MNITPETIEVVLAQYRDDYLNVGDLLSAINNIRVEDGKVTLDLTLGFVPLDAVKAKISTDITRFIHAQTNIQDAVVNILWQIGEPPLPPNMARVIGVKYILAVASGKGGVGKSTTAVNLALALSAQGARVGLLDADIYGPSLPMMVGIPAGTRPQIVDQKYFVPIQAHGLQVMSMGFLVDSNTPMVWRGPMASGTLQQLLTQTIWNNVDYLVVDMPPGTGDIQLTLAQKVPVSGAVIVTTPQDIALLDAQKGIEMFRKVKVPVLGVIENMAVHICSACGHQEHIFGQGGGRRIANTYQTSLLASLPLTASIRQQMDSGTPTVIAEPSSPVTAQYHFAACKITAQLWATTHKAENILPTISVANS